MGGESLTTLTASGAKDVTYVPAQGLVFARQITAGGPFVAKTFRDPVGLTESNKGIYDPLGNYIPFQQPPDPRPAPGQYSSASMAGLGGTLTDPYNYGMGCIMDGLPSACNHVLRTINRGGARSVEILGTQNPNVALANAGLIPQVHSQTLRFRYEGSYIYYSVDAIDRISVPGNQSRSEANPQDTSQQNPYPGCITANWFVNTPQAKATFDDYWRRTQQSQKENGGWFFYEPKTNTLIGKSASEGEKSSMPNEQREFDAQMRQFNQNGQSVILMFDFHTHPLGSGPSGRDMGNINNVSKGIASIAAPGGGHAPIGIVIHGPGKITLYDRDGLINKFSSRLNECL